MNSGLALQVKQQFPEVFAEYQKWRPVIPQMSGGALTGKTRGTIPLGSISKVEVSEGKWIVNAITQFNYGYDGKRYVSYDAVDIAFRNVARMCFEVYQTRGYMPTVHIPRIGAARGGGDLRSILELILAAIPESVDIILHAPPFQGREENGGLG